MPVSVSTNDDDLCCCEYVNAQGERTHILAFCCECDLIDDSFDRFFNKHQQAFPPGRMNNIAKTIFDRMRFPYYGGARQLSVDVIIPTIILPMWLYVATLGPYWTIASIMTLPFLMRSLGRSIRKNQMSFKLFYFCFTILGIIIGHISFELIIMPQMKISRSEYVTNMILITVTLYMIYKTKSVVSTIETENTSPICPNYCYCRICDKTIVGRDHHCVWLNCCVGVKNRYWFLGFLFLCSTWILYSTYLTLTSICYPVYLFRGKDYGYFLVPLSCPDTYNDFNTSLCFVVSMYGLGVSVFLLAIGIHQIRLLYKGVSYLEWKHGTKAENTDKSASKPLTYST